MVTVLHYTPGFSTGGIESRLLDWYRNTDRTKVRFVMIKLNCIDETDNIAEFKSLGGVFYDLSPLSFKTVFSFSRRIRSILIREKVDIVHVHDLASGIFVLREAKRLKIKCRILHSRSTSFLPNEKNLFFKRILKANTPRFATDFFACSIEAGVWGIGEKNRSKIQVIKNGIEVERFVYDENVRDRIRLQYNLDDKIVIGTVGRLSDQKNIPFLIKIFDTLLKENKNYRLMIVGDGDRSILNKCYLTYPISEYVILTGDKKNVWEYYMAFDIFCGTSLYEGFGTTAIESQASGLPTLVSVSFPETVVVTDFIWRLPIDDTEKWIEVINAKVGERYPNEGIAGVLHCGYDTKIVAKKLEKFYLNHS